jgi:hypothetical protein
MATAAALTAPAPAAAQVVPPLTFRAGPNSPVPTGGDAFAVVKTATRSTRAPGSPSPITTDLVVSNPTAGTVSVLLGDGNGGFALAPGSPLPTGGSGPTGLAASGQGYFHGQLPASASQFNGSLAVANSATNDVSLLFGNGSGGFGPAPGSPFGIGGSGPVAVGALGSSSGG